MTDITPETIAEWMHERLQQQPRLHQRRTAHEIAKTFGDEFTYVNKNRNLAIDRRVLDAFRRIGGDEVVWSRRGYYWRKREPGDAPSRSQVRRTGAAQRDEAAGVSPVSNGSVPPS
jgi:hypothetical protein